ncbi:GTP 3',8-cyclase MoaA [Varibaculum vaginae]|uniref:GTP 3',8-cyclase MoaA n=1 Tax=Varibaculum vaginae TaxID=2364797 RepID=UPI00135C4A4A|nr:GTP 3',8-cyclase MoaA [Varibaculum vaginae]
MRARSEDPVSSHQLLDRWGRSAADLRLSVTDRCNLRCSYCLPEDATTWIPRQDLLTPRELGRLTQIALSLGIRKVRLTGGEPLLRPDLAEIIRQINQAFSEANLPADIALTTNAIGLSSQLKSLIEAGLSRINISLDTLNPHRYYALAKRDRFPEVSAALNKLPDSGLSPIKLNSVILDQQSLEEIPDLVRFSLRRGFQWRAIEFMPIGPLGDSAASRPHARDILDRLREYFSLTPIETDPAAPARRWNVAANSDHPAGIIGVIASESAPFCATCDRTRLSADGKVYSCLFSLSFVDLLAPLRQGASNEELAKLWLDAQAAKPAGHTEIAVGRRTYSLSQIGG